MRSRRAILGCLTILIILLLAGGALLLWVDNPLNPRSPALAEDAPTLFIDILSPESAEILTAGQPVQVLVQTWSLAPLDRLELLVNGQVVAQEGSVGVAKPSQTTLRWEVGGAGVHTLLARATDLQGQVEESQTLILNVVALPFMEEVVSAGSSLESISQANGTTVSEVMALNPGLDPAVPLPLGQSIVLPPPNNAPAATTSETLQDPQVHTLTGVDMLIQWTLTTFEPVDQSYCYQSTDGQNWQRSPSQNFNFYAGNQWLQPIMASPTTATVNLFLDCWAWKGGTLTYLGQVQRRVALEDPPSQLTLEAAGFIAQGFPMIKPIAQEYPASEKLPAPFALRAPSSVNECAAHHGHLLAGLVCKQLMTSPVQNYHLMIWEWEPKTSCTLKGCVKWVDEIAGYQLFELGLVNPTLRQIKVIKPGQQVTAVPIPATPVCYALRAYAQDPPENPFLASKMVFFCPPPPPPPKKLVLEMDEWLSAQGTTYILSACGEKVGNKYIVYGEGPFRPESLFPRGTEILVGDQWVNRDKCTSHQNGYAMIHFDVEELPPDAIIHQATLKWKQVDGVHQNDNGTGKTISWKPLCATRLTSIQKPWSAPPYEHFVDYHNDDPTSNYWLHKVKELSAGAPQQHFSTTAETEIDVTADVLNWIEQPETNFGLMFESWNADLQHTGIYSDYTWAIARCWSVLDDVQLEVEYYAP